MEKSELSKLFIESNDSFLKKALDEFGVTSIHLVNQKLLGPGAFISPHHNYISFRDANGHEVYAIHGLSVDRDDGHVGAISVLSDASIKALGKTGEQNYRYKKFFSPIYDIPEFWEKRIEKEENPDSQISKKFSLEIKAKISEVFNENNSALWKGSPEDGVRNLAIAMEAAVLINSQNLDYEAVNLLSESQNSNSVAHTIAHAMGLIIPDDQVGWAPGHERLLIPEGFVSRFSEARMPYFKANDFYEMIETQPITERFIGKLVVKQKEVNQENAYTNDRVDGVHGRYYGVSGAASTEILIRGMKEERSDLNDQLSLIESEQDLLKSKLETSYSYGKYSALALERLNEMSENLTRRREEINQSVDKNVEAEKYLREDEVYLEKRWKKWRKGNEELIEGRERLQRKEVELGKEHARLTQEIDALTQRIQALSAQGEFTMDEQEIDPVPETLIRPPSLKPI